MTNKRKPILKSSKKVIAINIATISLTTFMLLSTIFGDAFKIKPENTKEEPAIVETKPMPEEDKGQIPTPEYRTIEELRKVNLETYENTYLDNDGVRRKYNFVYEEDVLNLNREFKYAIEDYLRSYGAGYWTSDEAEQFWPDDMEYIVTAIAYRESTYRTNIMNSLGCGGITCIKKTETLETLRDEWFVSHIWGENIPDVNCNPDEVDIFNPTTALELTYHQLGYNLANRFRKDKVFTDNDGVRRSIWDKIEYSEEMQTRLLIASYFWGIGNVTNSVFGRPNEDGIFVPVEDYVNSFYVEDVLNKTYELKNTYEQQLGR